MNNVTLLLCSAGALMHLVQVLPIAQDVDPDETRTVWEYLAGKYDANEDGKITRKEYGRSDVHFDRLDRDGNGVIEAADVEQGARRRGGRGDRKRVEAPSEGQLAPDFELELLGEAPKEGVKAKKSKGKPERVRLSKLAKKHPVALIFGSYT